MSESDGVATLVSSETFNDVAEAVTATGGHVQEVAESRPLRRDMHSNSDSALSKMKSSRPTRSRAVTGVDVVDAARIFIPQHQTAGLAPHSRIIDFDIDSLALGALATDLSRKFGCACDVATLVSAETFNEVAQTIAAVGGAVAAAA